jgi:hypothetical protein
VSQRLTLAKTCLAKKEYVQVWKQLQIVEKHMSGGVELSMMKVGAARAIVHQHQQQPSHATPAAISLQHQHTADKQRQHSQSNNTRVLVVVVCRRSVVVVNN